MSLTFPSTEAREALRRLTPSFVKAQETFDPPEPNRLFLPKRHRNAFDWNSSVVVGIRGAGKSVWTAALTSERLRGIMAKEWRLDPLANTDVHVAFGQDTREELFPSADTLATLDADARLIWKAVAIKRAAQELTQNTGNADNWLDRVKWVVDNPEASNRLLSTFDAELQRKQKRLLFVFDSLDRVADDWSAMRRLVKGALQFALSLRMTNALRAKLFLRPDQYDDTEIWEFSDSSKLKQSKADLSWSPSDLYGLLFQLIINDEDHGFNLRSKIPQDYISHDAERGYFLTPNCDIVNPAIVALAGQYMGRDRRRGNTLTWIPNHLADAEGRVSPRSLLLALNAAAEDTAENFANHDLALHYTAVFRGVGSASTIRVDELAEDYPWIKPLLDSLRGLTVPCQPSELIERWNRTTITRMKDAGKLPPRLYTTDPLRNGRADTLIDDLVELAVVSRASGGRINIPDIFRVSAGIKRKGGVPAAR
ncbi:MAG: hypothetical protein HQL37_02645 [Alphaproteobacteria bacterium]|nr:hypothetical protein [Alphaproteobacteria bacterium]